MFPSTTAGMPLADTPSPNGLTERRAEAEFCRDCKTLAAMSLTDGIKLALLIEAFLEKLHNLKHLSCHANNIHV